MSKISVAIPVYEAHGSGWLYLSELLNSIWKQTEKDVEIVISDQSLDQNIKNICDYYSSFLNLKYVCGRHLKRSNSPNANNAIKNCSSEIIKVIFQDDFFVMENALQEIIKAFESNTVNWLVSGCFHCSNIHFLQRPFLPSYNENIIRGINTISSPSVLSFRGKHYFDDCLIMMMDCDMYTNLYKLYGDPFILNDCQICNRIHPNQLQNLSKNVTEKEIEYCLNKYKDIK